MSDNLPYPVAAGTIVETVQQSSGAHRPVHRVPESDALLTQVLAALALLASHTDEVTLLAKAEQIRALLAAPVLATGTAKDSSLLSILAALPATLGPKAKTAALAITTATDDPALAAIAATGPGTDGFAVTPSDTASFTTNARSLYVGVAGDVTILTPGGTTLLFKNAPAGAVLPVQVKRVNATATTATNLIGLV